MFVGDSFFTLTVLQQVDLCLLSAGLWALLARCICWCFRTQRYPFALVQAVLVYWFFLWLSPQIYYLYYIVIFDDLPWQIVLRAAPTFAQFVHILLFQSEWALSVLSQGLGFWALLIAGAICAWRSMRVRG